MLRHQVAAIPLRLAMLNRHAIHGSVAWMGESASVVLPIVDVLVSALLVGDACSRAVAAVRYRAVIEHCASV